MAPDDRSTERRDHAAIEDIRYGAPDGSARVGAARRDRRTFLGRQLGIDGQPDGKLSAS